MVLIGLGVGYFLRKNIAEGKLNQAEQEAARIIANGELTADSYGISGHAARGTETGVHRGLRRLLSSQRYGGFCGKNPAALYCAGS